MFIPILVFVAHTSLLLSHRQKMGTDHQDRPQDPFFSRTAMLASFLILILAHAFITYRRVLIALGKWNSPDFLPLPANSVTLIGGTIVFMLGFSLRFLSIHILGRLFTYQIGIREGHQIIEKGPYRWIRHPSYTGLLLLILGIGLINASLGWILIFGSSSLAFLYFRIQEEEKMLIKHFGEPYLNYIKRTKKLIPFIY